MAAGGGTKAILAAMFANGGIAVAKFVAFLVTGASSMLAESIHSVADTSNQALLLLGGKRARRDASARHPFGYGRERYFWSFVVALILFTLGGLFALFEGIDKFRDPHEIASVGWAVGVLTLGILLEGYSLRTAIVESNAIRGSQSWTSFIRRARTPELPVVLLEDTGALIGLVVALIGVGLASLTGDARWDAAGTITIGVLLIIIAIILAVEMKSLLIGESATSEDRDAIEGAIEASPEVRRLIHLRTQHLGPDEILVTAKVQLDRTLGYDALTDAIDTVETRIRAAVPAARVIYLEPDVYDADHVGTPDRLDTPGDAHH